MANEKFTLEKPTLREVLPEDVVKYLREKYPPRKKRSWHYTEKWS